MASNRERFADMLYDSVSFGAPKKSEEEAAIYKRTAAARRVAYKIANLSDLIRSANTGDSVGGILEKWRDGILKEYRNARKEGTWPVGGTVMQNATIVKYNAGKETLGKRAPRILGGDERVWLVYSALGGPSIGPGLGETFDDVLAATRGHHTTGKYRQPVSKEHSKLLELLAKAMTRALIIEQGTAGLSRQAENRVMEILNKHRRGALNEGGGVSTLSDDPREETTTSITNSMVRSSSGAPRSVAQREPPPKSATRTQKAKEVTKAKSAAPASTPKTKKSHASTPKPAPEESSVAEPAARPRLPRRAKTKEQIAQDEALARENEKKQARADAKEKEDAEKAKQRVLKQKESQANQRQADKDASAWAAQQKKAAVQRRRLEKMGY
jgi:hypothetical protein